MNGWGDTSERRTFTVVLAVVFGTVITMLVMAPGDDANAALTAAGAGVPHESGRPDPARGGLLPTSTPVPDVEAPVGRTEVVPVTLTDPDLVSLVDDLRDDGIRFNAGRAMRGLIQGPAGEIPALNEALESRDLQFRHFAAGVLRARCSQQKAVVTERLLQVSVDALRSDLGAVSKDAYCTWVGPITPKSARFLRDHTAAASELLIRELTSLNKQQRFLSAYLLAQGGQVTRTRNPQHVARVAYELVGHLADNKTRGDAMMATHGLFRIGDAALPILVDNRRYLDEQGRKLVDLIRMDLQKMPRSKKDFYVRSAMVRISRVYHDPAVEYDMRRSPLPGFSR